jgi:glutamine amidotransferase-like uncharacterized protein
MISMLIRSKAAMIAGTMAAVLLSDAALAQERGGDAPHPLRVALFDVKGTGKGHTALVHALGEQPGLEVERIKPDEIRAGRLREGKFDVVIFPGGSGHVQGEALEAAGREQVRAFVRDGGGYVGICAGAYLATTDYAWSLHILDAKVVDRKHWARGNGPVAVALAPTGRERLGANAATVTLRYAQGPLLAPGGDSEVSDYEPLAVFDGEIAKNGAPTGVMKGTTAIAAGRFGKGRVLCFSPHPEATPGQHGLVGRGVLWVAGR